MDFKWTCRVEDVWLHLPISVGHMQLEKKDSLIGSLKQYNGQGRRIIQALG